MSKIALLGGAALLASVLATPALAQHRVAHPGQYCARGLAYTHGARSRKSLRPRGRLHGLEWLASEGRLG